MVSSSRPTLVVLALSTVTLHLSSPHSVLAFAPYPRLQRPSPLHDRIPTMSIDDTTTTLKESATTTGDGFKKAGHLPNSRPFKYEASADLQSVYHQMEVIDKKTPMTYGPMAFFATLFLGVPIWLTFLLPFTVVASVVHFGYVMISEGKLFGGQKMESDIRVDGGESNDHVGDEDEILEILPMEERKYDVVLLGATGYTGKLATEYLAKQYGAGSKSTVKWAIAGRSKSKLEKCLKSISRDLDNEDINDVDMIIVDTSVRSTLKDLVSNTRAVITTAGPFQKYGTPVVEFCVKYGTHYADITGEVDWSKKMMKLYESSAQKSGSKVVSFCGHDSIPWDITVAYLANKLREECNDELVSVECLDEVKGAASGGTLATVFEILDQAPKEFDFGSPKTSALDMYDRLPDGSESPFKLASDLPLAISLCRNPSDRFSMQWCGPFLMSGVNMAIVQRSVALSPAGNASSVLKYREAIVHKSFMDAFTMWFGLILFGTLIFNPATRPVVRKVVPQPGEGPSPVQLDEGFLSITGYGVGAKGNVAESVIYFPRDGGYASTARMLVESGLCLALDGEKHSFSSGGFYSPASIMTDALLDRLVQTGSKFACAVKSK